MQYLRLESLRGLLLKMKFQSYPEQLLLVWVIVSMGAMIYLSKIHLKEGNSFECWRNIIWVIIGLIGLALAIYGG